MSPARHRGADERFVRRLHLLALALLGALVYARALPAPFVLDDIPYIVLDGSLERLWPIGGHPNRPVLTFSLALDRALFGLDPRGYRATNVAIHVAGALLLYGLARRLLAGPAFGARARAAAPQLAFALAALWVVHPLQTQAVTYVWQRGESMMGLFFLATLYCTARCAEGERPRLWGALAFAACLLGLGTKEVMIAVFPVVLVVDAVLLAPSLRAALRRRWALYAAFGALAAALALVVLPGTQTSMGELGRWRYAASQPGIVLEYLRLALWPSPLCFDRGRAPAEGLAQIAPPMAAIALLAGASAWGLWRRSWLGVAGAWLLLTLAPSSSFVPINDLMVEYRMYLPLVAVLAAALGGGWLALRRIRHAPGVALTGALLALGVATARRNEVYGSPVALWEATARAAPRNPRAHHQLAASLMTEGRFAEAAGHARRAVELDPESAEARWNLGAALLQLGRREEALKQWQHSLRISPHDALRCRMLAELLLDQGRTHRALARFQQAADLAPEMAESHAGIARARTALGEPGRAAEAWRRALELRPEDAGMWRALGECHLARRELDLALEAFQRARALAPEDAGLAFELGFLHATRGEPEQALALVAESLRRAPALAPQVSARALWVVSRDPPASHLALALRLGELALAACAHGDAQVLLDLARMRAAAGERDAARALLDEVLALAGLSAELRAECEAERRRLEGAG